MTWRTVGLLEWAGLDLVVRTTQVQRGLGASKLAIPGRILTGGDESANGSINYRWDLMKFQTA